MYRLSPMLLLTLAAAPASAEPFEDVFGKTACYLRAYDAAHLAAHPNQQTTRLALSFGKTNQDGAPATAKNFSLYVSARRKGSSEQYEGLAFCKAAGDGFDCQREGDMGSFRLTAAPGGRLKMDAPRTTFEGQTDFFTVENGRFTIEGEKKTRTGKADDSVFLLDPAPAGNC
ncbi:MAG: hypothetical protein CTY15_13785 [Methylocystis sp.]|nr:MAG: hypothetical protein CTY15_13785 [Methylocystis sp.]